jgi:hypothetical protein
MAQSAMRRGRPSIPARVCLVLACLFALAQAVSLVKRVHTGNTDFSVFYRTAEALRGGAGPELYGQRDEPTQFFHCIPPTGTAGMVWMPLFSPTVAAVIWSVLNLALLALAIRALGKVYAGLDRQRRIMQVTLPWAAAVLLTLASGSLQVGQLTVVFVVCWIWFLAASLRPALPAASFRRSDWAAGFALAIPAAIKLYPLLLAIIPLLQRRWRVAAYGVLALAALVVVVPAVAYGPRSWALTEGFFRSTILDARGRLSTNTDPNLTSNQAIDVVLIRYLTANPAFQAKMPWFPHADLSPQVAATGATAFRLVVLLVTLGSSWQWLRRGRGDERPNFGALLLLALWCAALYLLLPETKSRYCVYVFPAFLPLLAATAAAGLRGKRGRYAGLCAVCVACVLLAVQFMPDAGRATGISLLAPIVLWGHCLGRMAGDVRRTRQAPL